MEITPAQIQEFLEALEQNPRRISNAARPMREDRLYLRLGTKSWSVNDNLAHLRSCADVWGDSIRHMLAEDNPTLPDIHPRRWVRGTGYTEADFWKSLKAYSNQRKDLLKVLKMLSSQDFSRGAVIGSRRHTIASQARRMARHEMDHCRQIESLLK